MREVWDVLLAAGFDAEQMPEGWALFVVADGEVLGVFTVAELAEFAGQLLELGA